MDIDCPNKTTEHNMIVLEISLKLLLRGKRILEGLQCRVLTGHKKCGYRTHSLFESIVATNIITKKDSSILGALSIGLVPLNTLFLLKNNFVKTKGLKLVKI